ncbi:hypothetical protein NEOKW01_1062 [Nematocida sp. AWRm80]|nr:hypothetical protein NEOKW01_1062 [Nematocida sp. AWRm80]
MNIQVYLILLFLVEQTLSKRTKESKETKEKQLLDQFKVGIFTTYPPGKCGIGEFSKHMIAGLLRVDKAMEVEIFRVTKDDKVVEKEPKLNRRISIYDVFCTPEKEVLQFEKLARHIKGGKYNALIINHEYGMIADYNNYLLLLSMLKKTKTPVYTIFHIPLSYPPADRLIHMRKVAKLSSHVVVMTWKGKHYLHHGYGVPKKKISYIPFGLNNTKPKPELLTKLGIPKERFMILTDGIMHEHKGLERMVAALALLKKKKELRNLIFVVAGLNRPEDTYMKKIQQMIIEKGLTRNFMYINKFVTEDEMATLHSRTDLYITLFNERVPTSRSLTYAMFCGNTIISTPYRYALELLGGDYDSDPSKTEEKINALLKSETVQGDSGMIVPFENPSQLADAIIELRKNKDLSESLGKAAKEKVKKHTKKLVGQHFSALLRTGKVPNDFVDPYPNTLYKSTAVMDSIRRTFAGSTLKVLRNGFYSLYKDPFIKINAKIVDGRIKQILVKGNTNQDRTPTIFSRRMALYESPNIHIEKKAIGCYKIITPNLVFLLKHKKETQSVRLKVLLENMHGNATGLLGSTLQKKYDLYEHTPTKPGQHIIPSIDAI